MTVTKVRWQVGDSAPRLTMNDVNGVTHELHTTWQQGGLVISFLRHFGWPFCRKTLASLASFQRTIPPNVTVMAVGMGDAVEARFIVEQYAPNIMCMIDQNQQAYEQFGLGRAGIGAFFAPQVAIEAVKITLEGYGSGAPIGGDVMQMPGTFVVDRTGHFRLAYYSRNIADHPRDDLMHAALLG